MTQPKKDPDEGAVTKSNLRIGKITRKKMIERYRRLFESGLKSHLESNTPRRNSLDLWVPINNPFPKWIPEKRYYESCPVCRHKPIYTHVKAHPNPQLTVRDATEFLGKLGFPKQFKENYLEILESSKKREKEKRKMAFDLPDIKRFIEDQARSLSWTFPGIRVATMASILEELLTKKGYTPGEKTIEKQLTRCVKESRKSETNAPSDFEEQTWEDFEEEVRAGVAERISKIQKAAEKAIEKAKKEGEDSLSNAQ